MTLPTRLNAPVQCADVAIRRFLTLVKPFSLEAKGSKETNRGINGGVMQYVGDAVQAPRMQAAGLSQEDYIAETYVKCAHIILGSRIFQSEQSRPPIDRRSGRWFLLEIEELGGLTQRLEPWRRDVYAPLIIEVSIQPWDTSTVMPGDSSSHQSGPFAGGGAHAATGSGMLLERWTLAFTAGVNSSSNSRAAMDTAAVYKRLILLIRSLYSTVRILPAYRMYRACKRHGGELFNTRYSLSTTADPSMQPLQHWPQHHQQQATGLGMQIGGSSSSSAGRMCHFAFTPVEALGGAFSIYVEYQPAATVHILEQTTIPVSMPRIISDYVDSPFARSAPNTADQAGRPAAGRAGSRLSGPEDPLALLRSSQLHHTPLVRHSWSSRDVSGPTVVQRGFSPVPAASSSHQQQQPPVVLHQRTSSQGSAGLGVPLSPGGAGGQSPVFGAAGGSSSRPPLPHTSSLHAAAQGSVAQGSRGASAGFSTSLPSGYSALMAGPGLPPASPGTPSTGLRSPLFRSSSLSTAAAIGAGGSGASAGAQQQGASRLGTSPVLLQQLRQQQQHPRPPVQPLSPQSTQQGFHVKPQEHNSSGQAASGAAAAAGVVSDGGELQQEGPHDSLAAAQQNQVAGHDGQGLGPSAVGAGDVGITLIRPDTCIASQQHQLPSSTGAAGGADTAAAVAGDASSPGHLQVAASKSSSSSSPEPGADSSSSSSAVRAVSAPVMIPYKAKGVRARSVSDLVHLDAEAVVAATRQASTSGAQQQHQAGTDWPQQQQQQQQQEAGGLPTADVPAVVGGAGPSAPTAVNTRAAAGGVAAGLSAAAAAGGFKSSSSSGLLKVHQHHMAHQQQRQQQQLVQAPSSAPAAPRGMLGQLLSAGSGPTSPAFSPRSSAAHRGSSSRVVAAAMAAVAAATSTREAAYAAQYQASGAADDAGAQSDSSSSSGTSSAADGIISSTPTPKGAIIIRPSPLIHVPNLPAAASSAGAPAAISSSPAGSSSCSSQPNSLGSRVLGRRMLAAQGFAGAGFGPYQPGLGVQPGTPTAPHSYLGSSPQLPFAFTPSGASLGTSLMSLADTQRQLMPSGAAPAASGSSSGLKPHAAPLSRPGSAAAAAAAAAAISAAGAAAAAAAPGAAAAEHLPGSTAAAGVGAGVCAVGSSSGGTAGLAMGTPSPPLLYPQATASGGQVSFIRDISGLATIRRPSWSSRSSSFDIAAAGSSTLPHHLSMSPGMADLMDPNLMLAYSSSHGSSAPGNALLRAAAGSSSHGAGSAAGGSSATGSGAPATVYRWNLGQQAAGGVQHQQQQQQQLQQPSNAPQQQLQAHTLGPGSSTAAAGVAVADVGVLGDGAGGPEGVNTHVVLDPGAVAVDVDAAGGAMLAGAAADEAFGASTGHDESESDLLPFVLDAEPGLQHQQQLAAALGAAAAGVTGAVGGGGVVGRGGPAAAGYGEAGGDAAGQKDVAVGAFLQLVQEAAAAPVGKLDRRQAVWQEQQRGQGEGEVQGAGGIQQGVAAPVCVGDAVQQVQELAAQLQQLLFPESFA